MLRFLLDTSAVAHLVSRIDYRRLADAMKHASEIETARFHFSAVGFYEYVGGVTANNLSTFQHLLRQAVELVGKDNLLIDPGAHVQARLGRQDAPAARRRLERDIERFLAAGDLDEFYVDCHNVITHVDRMSEQFEALARVDLARAAGEVEAVRPEHENGSRRARVGWSADFDSAIEFFELDLRSSRRKMRPGDQNPSLACWSDTLSVLVSRRAEKQQSIEPGDVFALGEVVYLDVCDYLVSESPQVGRLLDACGNPELLRRPITADELDDHLGDPRLAPRAARPEKDHVYTETGV